MQIHLILRKIQTTSKEDEDLFYIEEKFRSTSNEDVDPFYFKRKNFLHADF